MLWFYTRDADTLRAETRFDNETAEYVLVVHWPDGRTETERYPDAMAFQTRLTAFQQRIQSDRWQQHGPPMLLEDGWPQLPGDPETRH